MFYSQYTKVFLDIMIILGEAVTNTVHVSVPGLFWHI